MAVSIKDIETLWKRYQEDGCKRGISVAKFFESNGVRITHLKSGTRKESPNLRLSIVL